MNFFGFWKWILPPIERGLRNDSMVILHALILYLSNYSPECRISAPHLCHYLITSSPPSFSFRVVTCLPFLTHVSQPRERAFVPHQSPNNLLVPPTPSGIVIQVASGKTVIKKRAVHVIYYFQTEVNYLIQFKLSTVLKNKDSNKQCQSLRVS